MSKRPINDTESPSLPVRLLACDDLGLVKGIGAPSLAQIGEAQVVSTWGKADRDRKAAECIALSSSSLGAEGQMYAAVGRCDGSITVYDVLEGGIAAEIEPDRQANRGKEPEDRAVVSLAYLTEQQQGAPSRALIACTHGGTVTLHGASQAEGDNITWQSSASWAVPKPVYCMDINEDDSKAAFGCQGAELSIWDVATQQISFLAKGAKPNRVGLMDLPANTAVTFIPGSEAAKVLTGTAKHKLRLYDVRSGRRPVLDISFGEARISALAQEANGNRVWAATAGGQIEVLDLTAGKMSGALKGPSGSVRALALHPTEPLLASVSLDRYLRVHNTSTRKQVASVYLKQHLTGVTFCPALAVQNEAENEAAAEEHDKGKPAKPAKKHRKIIKSS